MHNIKTKYLLQQYHPTEGLKQNLFAYQYLDNLVLIQDIQTIKIC